MPYERQHLGILKSRMAEPRRRMQIIMGPRQVGKSTLVGQYVDDIDTPYDFFAADGVNREDTTWIPARWQEARMKMDLHGEKERILIIDEVQKIKTWSEQVKKEWDRDTREKRNLKVILLRPLSESSWVLCMPSWHAHLTRSPSTNPISPRGCRAPQFDRCDNPVHGAGRSQGIPEPKVLPGLAAQMVPGAE